MNIHCVLFNGQKIYFVKTIKHIDLLAKQGNEFNEDWIIITVQTGFKKGIGDSDGCIYRDNMIFDVDAQYQSCISF